MKNPIYYKEEEMEFIEKNHDELSDSIDSEKYISKYYIGSFRYPKLEFNSVAFAYPTLWFGYRKMYLVSFLFGLLTLIMPGLAMIFGILVISKGNIRSINASNWMIGFILLIGLIVVVIFGFLLGKYANLIYFKSLKKRVISRNEKKYGKSKLGILYGFLLGTLGNLLAIAILAGIVVSIIALVR